MDEQASTVGRPTVVTAMVGLCCALPVLASAGVLGALVGLGAGSWLIAGAAVDLTVMGTVWWRRSRESCDHVGDDGGRRIELELRDEFI